MKTADKENSRRISLDLPNELIHRFDMLKREWGLRSRGDVLERILEELLTDNAESDVQIQHNDNLIEKDIEGNINKEIVSDTELYNENKALVLIGNNRTIEDLDECSTSSNNYIDVNKATNNKLSNSSTINLPAFVRKRTMNLKNSISNDSKINIDTDNMIKTISDKHIQQALELANNHWFMLYGQKPKENVVEAAMIWLARDIWPNLDTTDGVTFTWTSANKIMNELCTNWVLRSPSLDRIIVIAGLLEDPFSSEQLVSRIPTLIRRFVNRFKRSRNVTSFQTIEATMTVHGALKLLDLPTQAGASLALPRIREAYKLKALDVHPDSGGSTESMRRVNEAYQLLKELYRNR